MDGLIDSVAPPSSGTDKTPEMRLHPIVIDYPIRSEEAETAATKLLESSSSSANALLVFSLSSSPLSTGSLTSSGSTPFSCCCSFSSACLPSSAPVSYVIASGHYY